MRKILTFSLLGVFLGIMLSGGLSLVGAQAELGKSLYDSKCAMCHGQDGSGNGPAAAAFTPAPKDFNSPAFWQSNSDAQITDTIENGHGPMPAVDLSSSQTKAVIAYMKQAFKK